MQIVVLLSFSCLSDCTHTLDGVYVVYNVCLGMSWSVYLCVCVSLAGAIWSVFCQ